MTYGGGATPRATLAHLIVNNFMRLCHIVSLQMTICVVYLGMLNETMKEKANNLKLGAIYKNAQTNEPMRLIQILPCEGAWMEAADGSGFHGPNVKFEDVLYASLDEVQDFLEDVRVFTNNTLVKE